MTRSLPSSREKGLTITFRPNVDEVLDHLLDQEGLEVDPIDRLEGDTPLHKAVRFANGQTKEYLAHGTAMVELLLDAGADPRSVLLGHWFRGGMLTQRDYLGYATMPNSNPWN